MRAEAAIDRLLALHPKGFDLSLERIAALLANIGHPERRLPPVFHIAGTNGKGSTAAFLRAILEAAGSTVHVHTSPHLVNWHERYRLGGAGGGRLVADDTLADAVQRVADANGGAPITVFEIMSAVGFLLFAEYPADYAIVEVGLGGRFDATNVVARPLASLIAPIGLDHQAYLGDSIDKIAFEKAGIIKEGTPVVIGEQAPEALAVIEEVATTRGAPTRVARKDFDYFAQGGRFIFQDGSGLTDLPLPRLAGTHQLANAALAIAAIRAAGLELPGEAYENGMRRVSWPGRFERLKPGALLAGLPANLRPQLDIWIDGGHNPQAGAAIASELAGLEERAPMPLVLICGMLTTKDPSGFFRAFADLAAEVLTVPVAQSDSGFEPSALAEIAARAGLVARDRPDIKTALEDVAARYGEDGAVRVLICGSLYLIGECLALNETPPS